MEKTSKKTILAFSIIIVIFIIGIVPKEFQNDTFFNISIGEYIVENGISSIDMQEHWAFTEGLSYTFSHWLFDCTVYLIYNVFDFFGIYVFTIILSSLTYVALFYCLTKKYNSPIISLLLTLTFSFFLRGSFTARSQIISFICFIIEIYCIEEYIDTNKKRYAIGLVILSIIIANFHAATWPLFLVLFMPYIATAFINFISSKNMFRMFIKRDEKKLKILENDSKKYNYYSEDLEIYKRLLKKEEEKKTFNKIVKKEKYNAKNLVILMVIIALSGFLTPIRDTPYTYIIKSMFGTSNFEGNKSVDYISEMQPLIPINTFSIVIFLVLFVMFLAYSKNKIKVEHIFLVCGLLFMTLISCRYVFLCIPIGCYVLCDLISQYKNIELKEWSQLWNKLPHKSVMAFICIIITTTFTLYNYNNSKDIGFINEELYPVAAVEYIKENLDYENIRIYNSYNFGSYLMLNDIPVFIDSRLDVYCSEFNDTDIFYDYVQVAHGYKNYEEIFSKYDFTHILLYDDEVANIYIKADSNYKLLYEDDNFYLYERNVNM